jgi:hypothetical protein
VALIAPFLVTRPALGQIQIAIEERDAARRRVGQEDADLKVDIPQDGGSGLPSDLKSKMEGQLGADLSGVKIHTDGASAKAADGLGARAFTIDQNVHFGAGQFAPNTKEGDRLIAHELAHTVQGTRSGIRPKAEPGEGDAGVLIGAKLAGGGAVMRAKSGADPAPPAAGSKRDIDKKKPADGASDADWQKYLAELNDFLRQQSAAEKGALLDMREQREEHPSSARFPRRRRACRISPRSSSPTKAFGIRCPRS